MKRNKIGISYNVFDGIELLKPSILQLRHLVDYINIVYQTHSYYNNPAPDYQLDVLNDLIKENLIDELILYKNDFSLTPHQQEVKKRNIGLSYTKSQDCTHFINMDCDEFYKSSEVEKLFNSPLMDKNVSTFCKIQEYVKEPICKRKILANYLVPFITKINNFSEIVLIRNSNHDPTRLVTNNNQETIFKNIDLIMHHFTQVRVNDNSLLNKINNSSSKGFFGNINIEQFKKNIDKDIELNYIKCKDQFQINKYLDEFKKKYL